MAQVKVFYEPETELLTVFWQQPRKEQICTELGKSVSTSNGYRMCTVTVMDTTVPGISFTAVILMVR